jgi:hypothetical protein
MQLLLLVLRSRKPFSTFKILVKIFNGLLKDSIVKYHLTAIVRLKDKCFDLVVVEL